jgi:hypothetical protein
MTLPAFAELLERLVFSPGRNAKLALLGQWFAGQPDPERGFGLAAITESLKLATAKPACCGKSPYAGRPCCDQRSFGAGLFNSRPTDAFWLSNCPE